MNNDNIYCVILCGGVGRRFWPVSNTGLPKQFLDVFGVGRTLLQQTYDRFRQIISRDHILLVTNESYANLVQAQLPEMNPDQILLEPTRRNTAPSVAWASYHIMAMDAKARMVVTPADQLIVRENQFLEDIRKGLDYVKTSDDLLTVGIRPNRPETAYGYIQVDNPSGGAFHKVKTFTEKPEHDLAEVFIRTGEFFWNSGLFMWNVDAICKALEKYLPDIVSKLEPGNSAYGTMMEKRFIDERYPALPSMSIDLGLIEKARDVTVMLSDFGWTDVGSWHSLYDMAQKDPNGNVSMSGISQFYDARDNMVVLPKGKLAVVEGLEGYLVAESENVLLICRKDDEASIRKYVNQALMAHGEEYI